jgi:hypothetical protein
MKHSEYDNGWLALEDRTIDLPSADALLDFELGGDLTADAHDLVNCHYFSRKAIALINNELLKDENDFYFNLMQRQKGVFLMSMMEAIHSLYTSQIIIEYREELCQELSKVLDEAILKHNESKLNVQLFQSQNSKKAQQVLQKQDYNRLQCKKLLQLIEFRRRSKMQPRFHSL